MNSLEQLEFYQYASPTYENFIGFVRRYLAPHMNMHFVEEEYYRELWTAIWAHRKIDAQISRGHSKSELLAVWATIYMAVYQPYNPFYEQMHGTKKRIIEQLVVSSDGITTGELFDRIKNYFAASDELRTFMPRMTDDSKWNTEKIELKNGSVVYARSIKMKRGLHLDRVVCDDLTTESSTLSDEETWNFFSGALLPMTTVKEAMIMVDGTPLRITDIMMQLHKKEEGWHHIKLPAILDKEKQILLSPNRFKWESLMAIKRDQGSVKFEAEYMLNPIDDTVSLIKSEWVRGCFDPTLGLHRHRAFYEEVYLGVDFAFSDRKTSDWSVFCIVGVSRGQFFLLDYIRRQGMSGMDQLAFIKELNAIYRFDMIGLEENSIQAILREVRELGLPIKLFRTGNIDEKDKHNPDFSRTISVSKRNLVLRLGATFENHAIKLPYKDDGESRPKTDRLLEECISWAQEEGKLVEIGVHPDIPIALGYALEVATKTTFAFDFA